MRNRLWIPIEAAAAAASLLLLPATALPVAAQSNASGSAASEYHAPRTSFGHPDLSGYWSNLTYTPLERPAELGTKEFYTEDEAKALEQQLYAREHNQPADDVHYDNVLWQSENYSKGVSNRRTSLIYDPPNGRIPPLSPEGEKHAVEVAATIAARPAAESYEVRGLNERCISWGAEGPPMVGSTYNANMMIAQTAGQVVVYNEMIHNARIITLNDSVHLPEQIRQLGGDSIGHWEGETLVVETTNFNDLTNFRGPPGNTRQDIFSSPSMRVVERFTRIDPETIRYRFTVEDPATWTAPWSGELMMQRFEGPIYEYACHEGNYGLTNILEAARAAEAAAAK